MPMHTPVLLQECLDSLRLREGAMVLDATVGWGGHSSLIAKTLGSGSLVCMDRDQDALTYARTRLDEEAPADVNRVFVHGNFSDLTEKLRAAGFATIDSAQGGQAYGPFDAMLFDLGVSSPQFDRPERGFTYRSDAPLDMRMDQTQALTAREIVNHWSVSQLRHIFFTFGEERYAFEIARAIDRARASAPIESTQALADIVVSALPPAARRTPGHPAKRTFQAIRMAVNDELAAIGAGLRSAIDNLKPEGRLAVITFHSLEDRLVKNIFQEAARGCDCPPDFPVCTCGKRPLVCKVTRKPILPSPAELAENRRAHSAKLRVVERI